MKKRLLVAILTLAILIPLAVFVMIIHHNHSWATFREECLDLSKNDVGSYSICISMHFPKLSLVELSNLTKRLNEIQSSEHDGLLTEFEMFKFGHSTHTKNDHFGFDLKAFNFQYYYEDAAAYARITAVGKDALKPGVRKIIEDIHDELHSEFGSIPGSKFKILPIEENI